VVSTSQRFINKHIYTIWIVHALSSMYDTGYVYDTLFCTYRGACRGAIYTGESPLYPRLTTDNCDTGAYG